MMADGRSPLDLLPLFATDDELGKALLGAKRAKEWPVIVERLQLRGFPQIDPLMGGRYVPAVRRYFDARYGLAPRSHVSKPDGEENWPERPRRRPADE